MDSHGYDAERIMRLPPNHFFYTTNTLRLMHGVRDGGAVLDGLNRIVLSNAAVEKLSGLQPGRGDRSQYQHA
ncbi:hypothetical protein CFR76_04430 [Komagataeibacter swingsii]|uniref:Uncharacterized protein n=1 Tax=Komagataeibacter swingsii TaxID=215220 RepID=A0A2V4RPQ8_9PROT|nr:hypothetical protein CFR76_04430 [Komagataeibacter swingsii]